MCVTTKAVPRASTISVTHSPSKAVIRSYRTRATRRAGCQSLRCIWDTSPSPRRCTTSRSCLLLRALRCSVSRAGFGNKILGERVMRPLSSPELGRLVVSFFEDYLPRTARHEYPHSAQLSRRDCPVVTVRRARCGAPARVPARSRSDCRMYRALPGTPSKPNATTGSPPATPALQRCTPLQGISAAKLPEQLGTRAEHIEYPVQARRPASADRVPRELRHPRTTAAHRSAHAGGSARLRLC